MADGRDVTSIARDLHISTHTCRGHVKNVLSKVGAQSQLQAVITAVRIGLIQIRDEPAEDRMRTAADPIPAAAVRRPKTSARTAADSLGP